MLSKLTESATERSLQELRGWRPVLSKRASSTDIQCRFAVANGKYRDNMIGTGKKCAG